MDHFRGGRPVDFSTGDYSGIGNFVVNTGNNNNLQGVISVNIATLGGS